MRFSYDAFVLKNKKDAIYYSGPFSVSERTLVLNKGESITVDAINFGTNTVTAAVKKGASTNTASATDRSYAPGDTSVEADVTFNNAIGTPTKGTDYTVTLTAGSENTVVNVTVI